jgi:hypothetical protein
MASLPSPRTRTSPYRVRFRHSVYPASDTSATRADFKKYDYFFGGAQTWVRGAGVGEFPPFQSCLLEVKVVVE